MPDCPRFWCQSGIDLVFRFYTVSGYRDIRVTVLTLEAPAQIIMSAVNCTRTATTGHILVSVSRFDYIAAQIAVDSIFDYFHSLCPPVTIIFALEEWQQLRAEASRCLIC